MMSKIQGHPTYKYKEAEIQRDQIKSQFSLFAVVMLYKVNGNTELANAELLLLGEIQGEVPVSHWPHFCQPNNTQFCFMCVSV